MPDGVVVWRRLWDDIAKETGRPQARWLCEVASGLDGDELRAALDTPAGSRQVAHLDAMIARWRAGEPLQYVLGRWAFRRLDLMVDRRVLIPRPETEQLVDVAIDRVRRLPRPWICADLGTGSGAIGLSLASELPLDGVAVWLTDASTDALDVARANLAGLGRAAANVRVARGSWFEALPLELRGALTLLVANPPYIADGDPALEPVVRQWEPPEALFAGADGLSAIREIVAGSPHWLAPGGWLVIEIGAGQGPAVRAVLASAGLVDIEILGDLAGHDRIAVARRAEAAVS